MKFQILKMSFYNLLSRIIWVRLFLFHFIFGVFLSHLNGQECPCARGMEAFAKDPDPVGLNVRNGPGVEHEIVGHLLHYTMVTILESYNQWFRIKSGWSPEFEDEQLAVIGWVYGPMLSSGFSGSVELEHLIRSGPGSYYAVIAKGQFVERCWYSLLGCKGDYLNISMSEECEGSPGVKGWIHISQICGNPVTTCP